MSVRDGGYGAPGRNWGDMLFRKLSFVSDIACDEFLPMRKPVFDRRLLEVEEEVREAPGTVGVVVSGWCYRYRLLEDGRRVIFNFWVPGDLINLAPIRPGLVSSTAAWEQTELLLIPDNNYRKLCAENAALVEAFAANERLDSLLLGNQVMRLGRQTAYERMLHLFLEIWDRLNLVGLTRDKEFWMPLTQDVLADALGLSTVHVSRTLKRLRSDSLIKVERRMIELRDLEALADIAEYDWINPP